MNIVQCQLRSLYRVAGCLLLVYASGVYAGVYTVAAREVAEVILKKGGRPVTEELIEKTTSQLSRVVKTCGPEAIPVCEKYGPKALRVLYDAGDDGGKYLVDAIAKLGDDAIRAGGTRLGRSVIREGKELGIKNVARFNDQIVPMMRRYGSSADGAFAALPDMRNAQRLLLLDGEKIIPSKHFDKMLQIVGKYGPKGLDFIWKNKGSLATAAVLTTFLADPDPYINGVKDLTTSVLVGPDGTGGLVGAVAKNIPWTTFIIGGFLFLALKWVLRHRLLAASGGRGAKPAEVIDVPDMTGTEKNRP